MQLASALRGFDEDVDRAAFRIAVRPDQVDDFRQEGMIAAHRAYSRYKDRLTGLELRKVMMRSAVNAMRSWQRKMVRFESAVRYEPPRQEIEESIDATEVREVANVATNALPGEDRQQCAIAYCRYGGKTTIADLAREIGCSRATASRAISGFKQEFKRIWFLKARDRYGGKEALLEV